MPRVRLNDAEVILAQAGAITRPSLQRREVLGCIACRLQRSEQHWAYGLQIAQCTGLPSAYIYETLHILERAGVIQTTCESDDSLSDGRSQGRKNIQPAQTELGNRFADAIEVPDHCDWDIPQK